MLLKLDSSRLAVPKSTISHAVVCTISERVQFTIKIKIKSNGLILNYNAILLKTTNNKYIYIW